MMTASKILESYMLVDRLKSELRHSWLSSGRRESVAEHTWAMCFLACAVAPHLERRVDIERTLKMIIVHDLVEAVTGDIPFFEASERNAGKLEREREAIEQISGRIPAPAGEEFAELWREFEERQSAEARFAKALDNLEVQMQHNLADFKTWEPVEYELVYSKMLPHCCHDAFLAELCRAVEEQGEAKMRGNGVEVDELRRSFA